MKISAKGKGGKEERNISEADRMKKGGQYRPGYSLF